MHVRVYVHAENVRINLFTHRSTPQHNRVKYLVDFNLFSQVLHVLVCDCVYVCMGMGIKVL